MVGDSTLLEIALTVYVDRLAEWGWKPQGVAVPSCHLFTDSLDLAELHDIAARIGMRRVWFHNKESAPHYDLTAERRSAAVALGAIELDWPNSVRVWKARRAALAASTPAVG